LHAAVTGSGFITFAATLQAVGTIPIETLAILFRIDKLMSECRALTNLVGNGVATIVVGRWEGSLDRDKLNAAMAHPIELGEALKHRPA
jgi:aerobic C4-dicarboxylate transport protein